MTTSTQYHCVNSHLWTTTPYSLLSSVKNSKTHPNVIRDIFLNHTKNLLENERSSFLFVFTVPNDLYYALCSSITITAFAALGITACVLTFIYAPPYLFTTLVLFAIIHYKLAPLFTSTLEERFFEAAYTKETLKLILQKEQILHSLTKKELNNKLKALGVSPNQYYNQIYKTSLLKNHPKKELASSTILIYILARYEYLQESRASSMKILKTWEKELLTIQKQLRSDDNAKKRLSSEERFELEEAAEKLSTMIYELYEFDLPSEGHTSLLSDSIQSAYLLHLLKNPLYKVSYSEMGKTLPKQSFERAALGEIPSAQAFFVTKNHRYIPKKFFITHLNNIPRLEKHLFHITTVKK